MQYILYEMWEELILGYGLLCCCEPNGSEHVTTVSGDVGTVGVSLEERFPLPAPPTREIFTVLA